MDASEADSKLPALTRSDAWLLASLTEGSRAGQPVTLAKFVHDADWLNRAIPTFDKLSFGLPRLVAHGLMTVDGLRLRATPRAIALRKSIRGGTLVSVPNGVGERVGARPYPKPEVEDRWLGRLQGLGPLTSSRRFKSIRDGWTGGRSRSSRPSSLRRSPRGRSSPRNADLRDSDRVRVMTWVDAIDLAISRSLDVSSRAPSGRC